MAGPLKTITNCMGYQQISPTTSTALTVPTTDKNGTKCQPTMVVLQCTAQNVRWRDDGTAPTSSVGMVLVVGDTLYYDGDLTKIRFIEAAGGAKLDVSYYS
jgi:hypothetical protein